MMEDKVTLSFTTISKKLRTLRLPEVDWVIGIATGGTVAAAMVAHQLDKPMALLHINFRRADNSPRYDRPVLLAPPPTLPPAQRILLVDDVAVSGQSLAVAKTFLDGHQITTLVLKGQADYVCFPTVAACVNWPWHVDQKVQPAE